MTDDHTPAPRRGTLAAYPLRGTRRPQPRPQEAAVQTRAAAQRHLDARGERLRAYAAALEAAIAAGPPADRRAQLERQLAGLRQDQRAAGRTRLPAPAEARGRGAEPAGTPAPDGDGAATTMTTTTAAAAATANGSE